MKKNTKKKNIIVIGTLFAAGAIGAAVTVPVVLINQYEKTDKDSNSNEFFNNFVNNILKNKEMNFYKSNNYILPSQLDNSNFFEYTNLPQNNVNNDIKIVYKIESTDNDKGTANVSMSLEDMTNNVTIYNIEITNFRTNFEQLNLNSFLFSNLVLKGNEKSLPSLLDSNNIESNLENLPKNLYGIKYSYILSDPNDNEGMISISIVLSIANLSRQMDFFGVKGFLNKETILTKTILQNPNLIFQNFQNILVDTINSPDSIYSLFYTILAGKTKAFNWTPTPNPFNENIFSGANAIYNSTKQILTINFITKSIFSFTQVSPDNPSGLINSFILVPIGATISVTFHLQNYNMNFNKQDEIAFTLSESALNPNTSWNLSFAFSNGYYFENGYPPKINIEKWLDDNKNEAIDIKKPILMTLIWANLHPKNARDFKLYY